MNIEVLTSEALASSLIMDALSLLKSGREAEIPLFTQLADPKLQLAARYKMTTDRTPGVGVLVDKMLDADVDNQARYRTVCYGSENIAYEWLVAPSRKHPGLFSVSEVACYGTLSDIVGLRGSIMISPERDLANSNSTDFSYFLENVVCPPMPATQTS